MAAQGANAAPADSLADEQAGDFLSELAEHPERLLEKSTDVTAKFRAIIREVYEQQSAAAFGKDCLKLQFAPNVLSKAHTYLGPLTKLEVGQSFDGEQLWEELEMRNEPFCRHMERIVKEQKVVFESARAENTVKPNGAANGAGNSGHSSPKEAPVGILKHGKLNEESESDDDDEESGTEAANGKPSVRFVVDEAESDEEESDEEETDGDEIGDEDEAQDGNSEKSKENGIGGKAGGLDDGFFNLADMEAFADEAEALALDGRLVASDEESEAEMSEEETEDLLFREGKTKTSEGRNLRYDEFFAPPMDDSAKEDTARALRRATIFDDGSGDESMDDSDGAEQTPLDISRAELRKTVDAMEDAAVAKKSWQLRGEVQGDTRPKNSVLDANFEHDIAFTNRAFSAPASAESIEDLIRQRIHDRLFDDVVRALPPEYEEAKRRKEAPEVSQEKPTEGLGELYAREYAEQREQISKTAEAAGVVRAEEGPSETAEQKEVNRLFDRLCTKLDAMASLSFTPSAPKVPEEMGVKPNVPALAAEEAIPEAVSDAALLAPGEVHSAKREKAQGELEKTKKDRRRNRRRTKKRLANLTKERTTRARQEEVADPILAEKRRAERALERRGKKPKTEKNGDMAKTGDFSKSNRFFANLQDSVAGDLAAAKVQRAEPAMAGSASQYKL